jgi:thioredoxin-related protein
MHKYLTVLFLCIASVATAQVEFTQHLSWSQIKAKARQENKYIFMDVYTTWCQPCKMMDKEIFPEPAVGNFMNAHFLNVHVQFDSTAQDNEEVKAWYPDVQTINKIKKIHAFPTLLFFNPQGKLVHVSVGAPLVGENLIAKAKAAMDPQLQYLTLQNRYIKGERSADFLKDLYKAALQAQDMDLYHETANLYLHQQPDLLTPNLVQVILGVTRHITDTGFTVLQQHGAYIDSMQNKAVCTQLLNTILFDDVLLPLLRKNGKKQEFGGGMYFYTGAIIKPINWNRIKSTLDRRFPSQSDSAIAYAKPIYQQWLSEENEKTTN